VLHLSSLQTLRHANPPGAPVTRVAPYDLLEVANQLHLATPGGLVTAFSTDLANYPYASAENLGANEWRFDFYPTVADAVADTNAQAGGTRYGHADGSYNAVP
jgi:hypothetical protein